MHRLKGLFARIRAIVNGERADRELDEEIRFHLEQETAKLERGGLSVEEARRRALVAFGGVSRTREAHRDVRVVRWVADVLADARFALRSLRRSPVIAVAAVITLALGIGTTTAIYTVVDSVIVRPLPFPHGERLFVIGEENAERNWHMEVAAPANMLDWSEQVPAFESVAGLDEGHGSATLTGDGESRMLYVSQVTGSLFHVLGVRPELGRDFRDDETWKQPIAPVIVSDRFWRTSLGADAHVLGRTIHLDGVPRQIVGVMPALFAYPYPDVDAWLTFGWDPANRQKVDFRRAHWVRTIARIKPTATEATANLQLQSVVHRLQEQYPETNTGMGATLAPLHDFIIGDTRRPLLLLLGAVGLLLLIACANVGNLLLVHAIGRQRELSLRLALGAGRMRLARQALTESLVLSILGGIAGLVTAWAGVRALGAIQPKEMLPVNIAGIDWRILLFLVVVTTVCGLAFGIAPALWAQRRQPSDALHEGGRSSSDGTRMRRWGHVLVISEVALALMLTVGAGLLVRSYAALRRVNPGFQPTGVITVGLQLAGGRYDSLTALSDFDARMLERVRAMPGVQSAALSSTIPLTRCLGWTSDLSIEGRARDAVATEVAHREVTPDYFGAMRVPLLRGRSFTDADRKGTEFVVVVNEALARRYFHGEDPIGKRVAFDRVPDSTSTWRTIVGVVGSEHQLGLPLDPHDEVFAPLAQDQQQTVVLVARTTGTPLGLAGPIRAAMHDIDPNLAIASMRSMEDVVSESLALDRFLMMLLAVFAGVGLALAIVGVYGVLAQMTRRRTREMGVRIALGARDAEVRWLVISHGLKLVAAGLVIGAVLALVLTRAMQRVLFDVPPSDPLTYVVVAMLLATTGAAAAWLPAYRASTTDPAVVLRAE